MIAPIWPGLPDDPLEAAHALVGIILEDKDPSRAIALLKELHEERRQLIVRELENLRDGWAWQRRVHQHGKGGE